MIFLQAVSATRSDLFCQEHGYSAPPASVVQPAPSKTSVRKSPVGLDNAAFAMELAGKLGSSVPFLPGVMEVTVKKILERIEVSLFS